MTVYEFIGLLLVFSMMRVVFVATRFVAKAKMNGYGLWHITINGYLRRKEMYLEWLKYNKVYLWSTLLVVSMCASILGLIGAFSHSKMFDRPKLVMIVGPIIWLCVERCYTWFSKRVN